MVLSWQLRTAIRDIEILRTVASSQNITQRNTRKLQKKRQSQTPEEATLDVGRKNKPHQEFEMRAANFDVLRIIL